MKLRQLRNAAKDSWRKSECIEEVVTCFAFPPHQRRDGALLRNAVQDPSLRDMKLPQLLLSPFNVLDYRTHEWLGFQTGFLSRYSDFTVLRAVNQILYWRNFILRYLIEWMSINQSCMNPWPFFLVQNGCLHTVPLLFSLFSSSLYLSTPSLSWYSWPSNEESISQNWLIGSCAEST